MSARIEDIYNIIVAQTDVIQQLIQKINNLEEKINSAQTATSYASALAVPSVPALKDLQPASNPSPMTNGIKARLRGSRKTTPLLPLNLAPGLSDKQNKCKSNENKIQHRDPTAVNAIGAAIDPGSDTEAVNVANVDGNAVAVDVIRVSEPSNSDVIQPAAATGINVKPPNIIDENAGWRRVTGRRSSHRNNNEDKLKVYYCYPFFRDTSEKDMETFLKSLVSTASFTVHKIRSKRDNASFKIGIPTSVVGEVLKAEHWPQHSFVKEWENRERTARLPNTGNN
jgi:hypothetical protein